MFCKTIRNPARKRFVKESKEVTVFVLEPSEVPFEAIEGWDVNDFHLHDGSTFYAFDEDYAYLCGGKVYDPADIKVPKSCKIYGLEEKGDELVDNKFDPENEDMVGCLVIERGLWSIDEELVCLNDFINGRGIYDVFMFEDVPVDTLEKIDLKYAFDELNDLGFDGGLERSEYVTTDLEPRLVPHNIDWSSYTNDKYVVIFNGKIVKRA